MCPYCEMTTGGGHAYNCPLYEGQKTYYGYTKAFPQKEQLSIVSGIDNQQIALEQIRELVDMYAMCEPGTCKDCDLLRQIREIAQDALFKRVVIQ